MQAGWIDRCGPRGRLADTTDGGAVGPCAIGLRLRRPCPPRTCERRRSAARQRRPQPWVPGRTPHPPTLWHPAAPPARWPAGRAERKHLRHRLQGSGAIQDHLPPYRRLQVLGEIREEEGCGFDAHQRDRREAGQPQFRPELPRSVAVPAEGARKERRQPTGALHRGHLGEDVRKSLVQRLSQHAVQARRPAGNRRHEHRRARLGDPRRLPQRLDPVAAAVEMVQRPQEQHRVH